ncbi:uncharacterized protein ACBR49_013686 [Aulostomus maculatus]
MEVMGPKKRPRRLCDHCGSELCHTQYCEHRKRYFKNGVWEKKSKRARSDIAVESLVLASSHDPTGGSCAPSTSKDLEDNFVGVGEIQESEKHLEDLEEENDETADDKSIHLFLDSSDAESVQDDKVCVIVTDEAEGSLPEEQSEAHPQVQDGKRHRSDQSTSEKPEDLLMKLLAMMLLSWQSTFKISDNAITSLLLCIKQFMWIVGNVLCANYLTAFASTIPKTLFSLRKLTGIVQRLPFNSPSTPLHGRDQPLSESPQTDEKKLLNAISGLSQQLTREFTTFATAVNEQFTAVHSRLLSMEDRLAALESKVCVGEGNSTKKRRVHNPKIAESVRRLHNSETNCRRYKAEQGLSSPHNEAVTSHLLEVLSARPNLRDTETAIIVSACKTYYETLRRSFRLSKPELAAQAETVRSSARSRSRRKRLLEARRSVLEDDEVELWKSATVDLMSDEEDGVVGGVPGWIVRPPPSRSKELSELCSKLQSRLEANPKYKATHRRRLNADRMETLETGSKQLTVL